MLTIDIFSEYRKESPSFKIITFCCFENGQKLFLLYSAVFTTYNIQVKEIIQKH